METNWGYTAKCHVLFPNDWVKPGGLPIDGDAAGGDNDNFIDLSGDDMDIMNIMHVSYVTSEYGYNNQYIIGL